MKLSELENDNLQGVFTFKLLCKALRIAWIGFIAASLTGCCSAREIKPEYGKERARLNGQDVVVLYFKNLRRVQQSAPDLCWAASLELALAHQGVDTEQSRIANRVYPKADAATDRTLDMFWWNQYLGITEERLRNGSAVYVLNEVDGGLAGPILESSTYSRKIAFEIGHDRIPLIGLSTRRGGGHVVAVIGAAWPSGTKKSTVDHIVGFLIYDPLTTETLLLSNDELFERSTKELVYVTTYESLGGTVRGVNCSAKNH